MRQVSKFFTLTPEQREGLYLSFPHLGAIESSWYSPGSQAFSAVSDDSWWLASDGFKFEADLPVSVCAALRVPAVQLADAVFAARHQRERVADAALIFLSQFSDYLTPVLAKLALPKDRSWPFGEFEPGLLADLFDRAYPLVRRPALQEMHGLIVEWLPTIFPAWGEWAILELARSQSPLMRPPKSEPPKPGTPPQGATK